MLLTCILNLSVENPLGFFLKDFLLQKSTAEESSGLIKKY